MHDPIKMPERVIVTIKVSPHTRARMRMLSAFLGTTQAELVEAWAVEQIAKTGLPDPARAVGQ